MSSATKENGATQNAGRTLYSILTAIVIGTMAWIGNRTTENTELLIQVKGVVDAGKEARLKSEAMNNESHARIEKKLEDVVTRREFDAMSARMIDVETRLRQIDLDILKLKGVK